MYDLCIYTVKTVSKVVDGKSSDVYAGNAADGHGAWATHSVHPNTPCT